MKVQIENVSSVKKKIMVNFPKETVDEELKKELLKIQKDATIKGFRKGKAPFPIVEKIYMPEAMKRYADRIIKESLQNITEENKLDVATRPIIEKEDYTDSGFEYHAIVEVHPTVELKNYKNLVFSKKKEDISDEIIENRILEMRNNFSRLENVGEGEKVGSDNVVIFDVVEYFLNDKLIGSFNNETVDLSKETIFKDIKDALLGCGIGEVKEFSFIYPEDMEDEKLRGKTAKLKILVKEIKKKVLPDNDELTKDLGYESFDVLKEKVKEEISTKLSKEIEDKFRLDMFNKLAEENPFDVPEGMVDEMAIKMVEDFIRNLEKAGVDPEKMNLDWKNMYEANKKQAEHILKRHYLMKAIKEAENIEVSEEDVNTKIGEIIDKATDKEKAKAYLSNPTVKRNIYLDLLENKIVDFIKQNNQIVEE